MKTDNVAAEEQEYDNKHNFKELLDTAKPVEKPTEPDNEPIEATNDEEKLQEVSEKSEDEKDEDEEDSGSDDDATAEKKETYNLSGMTKEEKKAHKQRIKEENREKRKNKMKKYDKNR